MSIEMNTPPRVTGYMLLFRGTNWAESDLSESEVRQVMDKVYAWFDGLSASGKVVAAQPLFEDKVVISSDEGRIATDGPFIEAKETIGGYVLLSVDSMEEAVAIAQTNPMHDYGLTTEVRATASSCPHLYRFFSRVEAVAGN